jgi:hypothetical protein
MEENPMPAIFHVTHWKAGSQWVKRILRECFSNRFIDAQIGVTEVRPKFHFVPSELSASQDNRKLAFIFDRAAIAD